MPLPKLYLFQSTLPTRGSDFGACLREGGINQYFNPRSPRGGATRFIRYIWSNIIISIHAPHEGERPRNKIAAAPLRQFQSTLPTRGSDTRHGTTPTPKTMDFNPRSPRGGATDGIQICSECGEISIHAPHEGERPFLSPPYAIFSQISIHAPHEGERRPLMGLTAQKRYISIHAPHEGERLHCLSPS